MNILFWLYRSRTNKAGYAPIMMRITVEGKRVSFSTNLSVLAEKWDTQKQRIKGARQLVTEQNRLLQTLQSQAWYHFNDLLRRGIKPAAERIMNAIFKKDDSKITLLEAFDDHIKNLEQRVGLEVTMATVKKYVTTRKKICQFLQDLLHRKDILLNDLDHKFITDLDFHMRSVGKLKNNAVMKNMQQLKRVSRVCILNGWLEKDPFLNYTCKLNYTERGYLLMDELKRMENALLPSKRLEQVRDIFVFCCYTVLAYADVSRLTSFHLETDDEENRWIIINRSKTGTKSFIPLLAIPAGILDRNRNKVESKNGNLLLPLISNQNLNKYLKEIADICHIEKRVSMHLARHTFATTFTLNRGVDIMTISKMLGHRNVKTTQIYAKVNKSKILDEMKKLT